MFAFWQLSFLTCVTPTEQSDSFYLVSSCPAGYADNQTAAQCERPDDQDALATVPCYSGRPGAHYRNHKCALCWGEVLDELTPWKVTVVCPEERKMEAYWFLRLSTSNLRRVQSELGCRIAMEPPPAAAADVRACAARAVRHCPTREHALYDACESYTALTTTDRRGGRVVYKNPHCALCNNPQIGRERIDFATDCGPKPDLPVFFVDVPEDDGFIKVRPGGGQPGLPGPDPVPPPPISILFDFRPRSSVKIARDRSVVVAETVECRAGEVYDPFSSRCRRLSCSDNYLLQGERCLPDLKALGPGQACQGDGGVATTLTVAFPDLSGSGPDGDEPEPNVTALLTHLRSCLADFLGRDPESFQLASSANFTSPTPEYSFNVKSKGDSAFLDLEDALKLPLADLPLCQVLQDYGDWSVALRQSCRALTDEEGCFGRWLNDTEFSLRTENDTTTTLYLNESGHEYALEQAILRANYRLREETFLRYADARVCAQPTLACPRLTLNASLFGDGDGVSSPAGAVVYEPEGVVFLPGEFVRLDGGRIQVCSFLADKNGTRNVTAASPFLRFSAGQRVLSSVGLAVSMAAELATFLTYCLFRELRKRISLAIMALVACLFWAQLLLLVSGSAVASPTACAAVAALGHFFWLASVFWTGVLAFGLNRVFASAARVRRLEADPRVFARQTALPFGGAGAIVLVCLALHLCGCQTSLSYGSESVCWLQDATVNLIAFGLPVAATILVNTVLFALTVHGIHSTRKKTKVMQKSDKSDLERTKEDLIIYAKVRHVVGLGQISWFAR